MSETATDLLTFLRNLADHLALGTPLPMQEIQQSLDLVKQTLEQLYQQYEAPAPQGAEVIREFMLEALQLFYQAVEGIEDFVATGQRDSLAEAVLKAEEANDILSSIEYVIDQNKQWLSQFTSG
ncbi:MAG: hypothetical protein AB1758_04870 [Candidatus Eremiobacterota bacterium]